MLRCCVIYSSSNVWFLWSTKFSLSFFSDKNKSRYQLTFMTNSIIKLIEVFYFYLALNFLFKLKKFVKPNYWSILVKNNESSTLSSLFFFFFGINICGNKLGPRHGLKRNVNLYLPGQILNNEHFLSN